MYFASLKVENVKSFGEKQILDLRDSKGALSPWTLILGDNGVGKTTLLKCLAWMLPVELPENEKLRIAKRLFNRGVDFEIIKETTGISKEELESNEPVKENDNDQNEEKATTKVEIKPLMDDFSDESVYNSIIRVGEGVEMKIKAEFTNGLCLKATPSKGDLTTIGIRLKRKGDEIEDILNTDHLTTAELEEFNSPNLFAYGAARHMASENFEKSELKEPTYNLFSNSGDLYDAEEVLLKLYNDSVAEQNAMMKQTIEQLKNGSTQPSIQQAQNESIDSKVEGKATKHLQKVKEILTTLLPHLDDPDCIIINQSTKKEGHPYSRIVEIKTPFGQVGLYDLSLGYQTMLVWVVDLAIRMFWQNPDSDEPLKQPAVVIIDEIDLHLHPKWQRTIKQYLTHHFPATQFICTAHSPFMAQASEDENLCVLHEIKLTPVISEVKIDNDPTIVKGWRIGQIIKSDLFGVPETSFKIEKWRDERREILDKPEQTPADKIRLEELNEELSKLPSTENNETQKLLDQIRVTAEILKKEGKLK